MSAPRLSEATRARWAARAALCPDYDRRGTPGVVHLGLGAFHRAHQAMVFDRLLREGDPRWGVHAVGMARSELVQALRAQDGLYAVRVADHRGAHWQVPGALWRFSVAAHERAAVTQAMAAPSTRWITLTVTEKGYTAELGAWLAQALEQRARSGAPGVTLASCDNLPSNGRRLRTLVLQGCTSARARAWIEAHCAFPCSMVDRIVPASSAAVAQACEAALGVRDASPLATEAFGEWVIEDHFADPADAALLARWSVRVTPDVQAYEQAKLRMLNGCHSLMALLGAITGRAHIADCIGTPAIRQLVWDCMGQEIAPHVARQDWRAYREALIARFGNPHLRHSVHQIAQDSSQKIPQRWPPCVLGQIERGAPFERLALAAAAFVRYTLGEDEAGRAYALQDPLAEVLRQAGQGQRSAGAASLDALLSRTDLWGPVLPGHGPWRARVAHWHARILHAGVDGAIRECLQHNAAPPEHSAAAQREPRA